MTDFTTGRKRSNTLTLRAWTWDRRLHQHTGHSAESCLGRESTIVHPLLVYPVILSGVSVALINFLVSTSFVSHCSIVVQTAGDPTCVEPSQTWIDAHTHTHTHTHTHIPLSLQKQHACQLPFLSKISLILSAVSADFSKLLKRSSKCVKHAIRNLFFCSLHLSPKERENGDCHWSWPQTEDKCWFGWFVQCCSAPDGLCVMQGKQKQAVLMRVRVSSCVAAEAVLKSLGLDTHADRVTACHTRSALPERHRPTLICCN